MPLPFPLQLLPPFEFPRSCQPFLLPNVLKIYMDTRCRINFPIVSPTLYHKGQLFRPLVTVLHEVSVHVTHLQACVPYSSACTYIERRERALCIWLYGCPVGKYTLGRARRQQKLSCHYSVASLSVHRLVNENRERGS